MSTVVLCACLVALIPALDQLSKYLVRTFMEVGDTVPVIKDFFHITYILNDGMAFGQMDGKWRWVFMIGTPILLVGVAAYLIVNIKKIDKWSAAALSMVFAGGLSNMIDRIFFYRLDPESTGLFDGRVIDFLDFRGVWQYIFNVADACVVVGIFLFLILNIIEIVKEHRAKNALLKKYAGTPGAAEPTAPEKAGDADKTEKEDAADATNNAEETVKTEEAPENTSEQGS